MEKKVTDRLKNIRYNAVLNKSSNALMALGLALFLRAIFEPFLKEPTLGPVVIAALLIFGLLCIILSITILFTLSDTDVSDEEKDKK